jgi:ABC-type multidrug transport system ATPase subunit
MFMLVDEDGKQHRLGGAGPWVVGRHAVADVRFDDPYCPRRAVQIERQSGGLCVTALSTSGAVLVNGAEVGGAVPLLPGARLTLGQTTLRLMLDGGGDEHTTMFSGGVRSDKQGDGRHGPDTLRPNCIIGRTRALTTNSENAYVLDDPTVSRRHARLYTTARGIELADLGSSNGTYVGGRRINVAQVLREGDQVMIGQSRFVFAGGELTRARVKQHRTMIVAQNIAVDVSGKDGRKRILQPATLAISQGEFVCLVGGSGAGKTTLMNAIAGRNRLSEGQIDIDGTNLAAEFGALKQMMAYVPQREILHDRLTVRAALGYVAELRLPLDTTAQERAQRMAGALARVEMTQHADTAFAQLSGGQKKRACLAAEILCEPKILFLDEVTSGLDEQTEYEIMKLLSDLARDGTTILCVTHALANIATFCDRVIVMAPGGYLAFSGEPQEALGFFRVERLGEAIAQLTPQSAPVWYNQFAARQSGKGSTSLSPGEDGVVQGQAASPMAALAQMANQFGVLMRRNTQLLLADRATLALALIQAVVIGFFVSWAFSDFGHGFQIVESKKALITMAVMSAMWIGASGASKDIVGEAVIVQRERDVNLSLSAYLSSRLVVASVFVMVQLLLVFGFLVALSDGLPGDGLSQYVLLNVVGLMGVAIGLLISACATSEAQATAIVPLALVPQLIMIGSIAPNVPKLLNDVSAVLVPTNVLREAMTWVLIKTEGTVETFSPVTGGKDLLKANPLWDSLHLVGIHYAVLVAATGFVMWRRFRSGASR